MSTNNNLAPWSDEDAKRWIGTLDSWVNMARLVQKTLQQEPRRYPHQIRAAASLVIMFCREDLWPQRSGVMTIEETVGLARRQLAQVKHQYSIKARVEPDLKKDPTYRTLMNSLDQEIKILESRISEEDIEMPREPPGTWKNFWHEQQEV